MMELHALLLVLTATNALSLSLSVALFECTYCICWISTTLVKLVVLFQAHWLPSYPPTRVDLCIVFVNFPPGSIRTAILAPSPHSLRPALSLALGTYRLHGLSSRDGWLSLLPDTHTTRATTPPPATTPFWDLGSWGPRSRFTHPGRHPGHPDNPGNVAPDHLSRTDRGQGGRAWSRHVRATHPGTVE